MENSVIREMDIKSLNETFKSFISQLKRKEMVEIAYKTGKSPETIKKYCIHEGSDKLTMIAIVEHAIIILSKRGIEFIERETEIQKHD